MYIYDFYIIIMSYINIREQSNSYFDASPTNRSDWALQNNKIICKCYS